MASTLTDDEIVALAQKRSQIPGNGCSGDVAVAVPPCLLSPASHETLISYLRARASSAAPSSAASEYVIALISLFSLVPHSSDVSSLLSSLLLAYIELFNGRKIPRDSNSLKTVQLFTLHLSSIPSKELVSVSESIVAGLLGIADAEDAQLLDVLPPCLDLIRRSNEIGNGEEVVSSVFDKILASNWSKALLVKMVSIVREFPFLDKNRKREFLEKVFDGMKGVDLQDMPSLSYQLLVAASKGFNKRDVMEGIVMFFGSKMGVKGTSTARQVEGTVLLHVNFAVKQDPSLAQEVLGLLKSDTRALNHFTVAVLLSVSRVRKFSGSCMGVLKTAVLNVHRDNEVARTCKWLPEQLKHEYSQRALFVEKALLRSVNESNYGREHIVPAFVDFGFLLLESAGETNSKKADNLDTLMGIEGLSIQMLKVLFEVHEMSRTEIIEHCKFRILSLKPRQCRPVVRLLGLLVLKYPYPMLEHVSRLKELLDYFAYIDYDVATCLITAILPLTRFSHDLQDYIILVVRKAMFSREETVRTAATGAVIDLILADKKSKNECSYSLQESSSQASCSQQRGVINGNNGGLFPELSCLLQRSLYQQARVKEILYVGLLKLVLVEPSAATSVFDFLLPHFLHYYHEDDELQLSIHTCVKPVSGKICVHEPLDCLLSCISWILILQSHGKHDKPTDSSWTCFGFSLSQENEGGKTRSGDLFSSFMLKIRKLLKRDKMPDILREPQDSSSASLPEEKQLGAHILSGIVEVFLNSIACELEKTADAKREDLEREIIELVDLHGSLQKDICTSKQGSSSKRGNPRIAATDVLHDTGSNQAKQAQAFRSYLGASSIYQLLLTVLKLLRDTCSSTSTPSQSDSNRAASKLSIRSKVISFVLNASHRQIKSYSLVQEDDPLKTLLYGDVMKLGPLLLKLVWALSSELKSEANSRNKEAKARREAEDRKECAHLALTCIRDLISISLQTPDKVTLIRELSLSLVECDLIAEVTGDSVGEPAFEIDDDFAKTRFLFLQKVTRPLLSKLLKTSSFRDIQVIFDIIMMVGSQLPQQHRAYLAEWIISICRNNSITESKAAQSIVKLTLELLEPPSDLDLAQEMVAEMQNLTSSEESSLSDMSGKFPIMNNSTWVAIASSILQVIESVVDELQFATFKLKGSSLVARTISSLDENQEMALRSALEEALYSRAEGVVKVLSPFMQMVLKDSQAEQTLRLAAKFYKQLALMAKLWIASKGFKQLIPTLTFHKLVEATCKELTAPLYGFIARVQQSQLENDKKKGIVNKIKRENRCIPDLIFQIEDYERYLIQLSKVTKLNLLRHAKRSTCRDFRILEAEDNATGEDAPNHDDEARGDNNSEPPGQNDPSDKSEGGDESDSSSHESNRQIEVADSESDGCDGVIAGNAKRRKSNRVVMASDEET